MRTPNNKRARGRPNRRAPNPNRSYESNGPEGKIRGNANQVYEKYSQLARDAQASGDPIAAEGFWQYAEHYYRIMLTQQQTRQQFGPNGEADQAYDDDDLDQNDQDQMDEPRRGQDDFRRTGDEPRRGNRDDEPRRGQDDSRRTGDEPRRGNRDDAPSGEEPRRQRQPAPAPVPVDAVDPEQQPQPDIVPVVATADAPESETAGLERMVRRTRTRRTRRPREEGEAGADAVKTEDQPEARAVPAEDAAD